MRRPATGLLLLLALLLAGAPAEARRLPREGGRLRLALPEALARATREAALGLPILEPLGPAEPASLRLARPALAGTQHRSRVLSGLSSEDGGRTWRLLPRGEPEATARALLHCLSSEEAWPGRALRAAGRSLRIEQPLVLRFSGPVGPLAPLLEGCLLPDAAEAPFQAGPGGILRARRGGPAAGRPWLEELELLAAGETADLALGAPFPPDLPRDSGAPGPRDPGLAPGAALAAPLPEVLLLLQPEATRTRDPLAVLGENGPARLAASLDAALLLAVYWEGRGLPSDRLLPEGLVPRDAGLRLPAGPAPALERGPLPAGAPRLTVAASEDPLVRGLRDRLALLLRGRGWALDAGDGDASASLLRWAPPSADPALALLALASEHGELDLLPGEAERLLAADPAARLEAALRLEERWLRERRALPLLHAAGWFAVPEELRGLRLRVDGVPLLDGAWWGPR